MPRMRNVRVSVQKDMAQGGDAWGADADWQHLRYQTLDLYPMAAEEVDRFAGVGYDANWKAIAKHPAPVIREDQRLVLFTQQRGSILLNVVKVNPRGRYQEVLLKEVTMEQPARGPLGQDAEQDGGGSTGTSVPGFE